MTEMYGSCTICILDEETHEIEELIPSSCTRGEFITPNRKNSNIYVGQLYDQFIIDLDGTLSETSYLTNKYDGSADFSYKSGEDGLIYFCDRDFFRLMDYNNASTLMWCDATYGLTDFTSSIDGKYAYAYKYYYPESYFYKFDTDYFYRHISD